MPAVERISLHHNRAVIRDDVIELKPARSQLLVPAVELLLAAATVAAIVLFINSLPPLLLLVLLMFAVIIGPVGVLGVIFGAIGSGFVIDRKKHSARWQQGFLGLGIGTSELVPFWRIGYIEVVGDYDEELRSGDRNDLVQWELRLVKDNGRVLDIGTVIVPRSLAAEGLGRANRVAGAVAELAEAEFRPGTIAEPAAEAPELAPADDDSVTDEDILELPRAARHGRRRVEATRRPLPPAAEE